MITEKKSFKEEFSKFFENPTRENFRELLKNNLGEFPYCDFKEELPASPKLAKALLGLANSGGGCVVIGVAENSADKALESKGVDKLEDKIDIINGIKKFIPEKLLSVIDIVNFQYDDSEYKKIVGKKFQVIFVEDIPTDIPFVSIRESSKEIQKNFIYIRRSASTETANHEELQRIINRRVETGYSSKTELDFETHFQQLRVLYKQIDSHYPQRSGGISQIGSLLETIAKGVVGKTEYIPNPNYPKENFEQFINRMIEKKKKRIEFILEI